ncbi:MAG: membrane protein [Gemmatales bacterium]|nr:MAG: membrane protein [Gemmatales bacterium]
MYKILLCWRYLLTRYLALACIISVTLGVATLIVVNSVMSGFSNKLQDRLHGLLSDIVIEGRTFDGFADPDEKMRRIRESAIGEKIAAMSPTMEVFAMMQFRMPIEFGVDEIQTRPVRVIGIDPKSRAAIGGFAEFLEEQKNATEPSFELRDPVARRRYELRQRALKPPLVETDPTQPPPPAPPETEFKIPEGIIVGHALATFRYTNKDGKVVEYDVLKPGSEVILTTVSGRRLMPVYDRFVVCDRFKSEMSEYDANFVFVSLEHLQKLRTMEDRVTSIQIKLKDAREAPLVVAELEKLFPKSVYQVSTWQDKQGPLLAAISIEKGILNILLFMIVGVAGFGILSIFTMIVVEKTRDIGILKALGASNGGIMKIFLGYGLLLGLVGAFFGTGIGLLITERINEIERFLTGMTGQPIFDREIYYFNEIPTYVSTWSILIINFGAVAIAVFFSVIPALKAALLHPVQALRYE